MEPEITQADIKLFMTLAYEQARHSPDRSTQNGAVLVQYGVHEPVVIGAGCNTLPKGVNVTDERLNERPLKYWVTEHAERNAILAAARHGGSTEGSVMFALWAACVDCSRAIIQAGVHTLVTHSFYLDDKPDPSSDRKDWGPEIATSFEMMEEAGIEVIFTDVEINAGFDLLFAGKSIRY